MKVPRRAFLRLAAGAAAHPLAARMAWAQAYPTRPVRIIVGFPAGGGVDIVARLVGQALSDRLGRPFVIENRTGAGSNIGTETVVRAPADGYTLLLVTAANAFNATLHPNLGFNFIRDIAPVASIARAPFVMIVNPSVPARTVAEFIAYAKANPGRINMGSAGNGSAGHVFGEHFKAMAGVDMIHVPYRASAVPDLIAGQVHVVFADMAGLAYVRAGKVRALAVTTATRLPVLPDVPTIGEFVPGYEASGFLGIGAPKDTPGDIVDKLNREINAGLADPGVTSRLADLGYTVSATSSAEFGRLIADETEKWGKVIRAAKIHPA